MNDDAGLDPSAIADPDLTAVILAVPGVALLYGVRQRPDTVTITIAVEAEYTVPLTLRAVRAAVAVLLSTEVAPPTISVKASRVV
ncbi:hypothetical protein BH09ACT6_BH09ACT6_13170 [soil metagenome]